MTHGESRDRDRRLAQLVLEYLCENPDAQDSLEGVRDWWIGPRGGFTTADEIVRVLDALVMEGFVRELVAVGSAARYRLNRDRLPELKRMLGPCES